MKIILEFTDEAQAKLAIDAGKWMSVLWELNEELRSTTKHGVSIMSGRASELEVQIAQKYRDMIVELMEERDIIWQVY
jgi:hypothetical protein